MSDEMFSDDLCSCIFADCYEGNANMDNGCGFHGNKAPPTHTEDGVQIRKLYITKLPVNATHRDLIDIFGCYGEIQHCTLRPHGVKWSPKKPPFKNAYGAMSTGQNQNLNPGYAFITFVRAQDAHRALCAGLTKNVVLRGRKLIVRPADTWHQPEVTAPPVVPEPPNYSIPAPPQEIDEASIVQESSECDSKATILDILDSDCLLMILDYISLPELIRSERVSKSWQAIARQSLALRRRLITSKWSKAPTTAALRAALIRCGENLRELCLNSFSTQMLNRRTLKTIARFCPRLETLYARCLFQCGGEAGKATFTMLRHLRSLALSACEDLDDCVLFTLLNRADCPLLELRLEGNDFVTGSCFIGLGVTSMALVKLSLGTMRNFNGEHLTLAAPNLGALRELHLDLLPHSCWEALPAALRGLPSLSKLEDLSLSHCQLDNKNLAKELVTALSKCSGLIKLQLWYNLLITDVTLHTISRTATRLRCLEVCGCKLVTADALNEALARLEHLQQLNLSRMGLCFSQIVITLATLQNLHTVRLQESSTVTADELADVVRTCRALRELDVRGASNADSQLLLAAIERCEASNKVPLVLRVARTKMKLDDNPSEEECHRLHLRLDWREYPSEAVNTYEILSHFINLNSRNNHLDIDAYSDEDEFMDEMSDMFSDSDVDYDIDFEAWIWQEDVS